MELYRYFAELGELKARVGHLEQGHGERLKRLETIVEQARHWAWRSLVLAAIWAWPAIALLKGPDIAGTIAEALKAALTR